MSQADVRGEQIHGSDALSTHNATVECERSRSRAVRLSPRGEHLNDEPATDLDRHFIKHARQPGAVPLGCSSGAALVQLWCSSDAALVQLWCSSGVALARCGSGAARVRRE